MRARKKGRSPGSWAGLWHGGQQCGMWQGWELGIPRWAPADGVGGQLPPCAAASAHKPTEEQHLLALTGFLPVGSVPELGRKITVWLTSTEKLPKSALKHRKGVLCFVLSTILPPLCTEGIYGCRMVLNLQSFLGENVLGKQ